MQATPLTQPIFLSNIILQKMIVSFYIEAESSGVFMQRYTNVKLNDKVQPHDRE